MIISNPSNEVPSSGMDSHEGEGEGQDEGESEGKSEDPTTNNEASLATLDTQSQSEDEDISSAATDAAGIRGQGEEGDIKWVFYDNGLLDIRLKDGLSKGVIPDYEYRKTTNSQVWPAGNTSTAPWNAYVDLDHPITSIYVGDGITKLGDCSFYQLCLSNERGGINNIRLPSTLIEIGDQAVNNSLRVSKFMLPEKIKSLKFYSFTASGSITGVTVPSSLKYMENCVFGFIESLRSIVFLGEEAPSLTLGGDTSYRNIAYLPDDSAGTHAKVYVPAASKNASRKYDANQDIIATSQLIYYSLNGDTLTLEGATGTGELTRLDELCNALGPDKVKKVVVKGLSAIGSDAFIGLSNIESVTLDGDFAAVDLSVFSDTNLKEIAFKGYAPSITGGTIMDLVSSGVSVSVPADQPSYAAAGWPMGSISVNGVSYVDEKGALQSASSVRLLNGETLTQDTNILGETGKSSWYVMDGALAATDRLVVKGDVSLILTGNTLKALGGIEVPEGSSLTIYSQATDDKIAGTLVAKSDGSGAAIGASAGGVAGAITINGGKIQAEGAQGSSACGIGGAGATVSINKGVVSASGSGDEAGIGGSGANVTINKGIVNAQGGESGGSGIGSSFAGDGATVEVNGGEVVAQGGEGACGIGGAKGSAIGSVAISGGDVHATGGTGACGIGAGASAKVDLGMVTLTGGSVEAVGSDAPGIGTASSATTPLIIKVEGGAVVSKTTGNTNVVLGDANSTPNATLSVSAPLIVETPQGKEPTRDAINCKDLTIVAGDPDDPQDTNAGVIIVVKDADSIVRDTNNSASLTINEPSLMLTSGFKDGVFVSGIDKDHPGSVVKGDTISLPGGSSFSFTNTNGEKVTVKVPETVSDSTGVHTISLAAPDHIALPSGSSVTVGEKGPITMEGNKPLSAMPGTITNATSSASNALNLDFAKGVKDASASGSHSLKYELAPCVLGTSKDAAKVSCGYPLSIWLKATDITQNAADESQRLDKTLINNHVSSAMPNASIGAYIDLSLYCKVSDETPKQITECNSPIPVELLVPDSLINSDEGYKRTYFIYRVHNGVAEALSGVSVAFNEGTCVLAFETDKFSTYAIAYADEKIPDQGPGSDPGSDPGTNKGDDPSGSQGGTGDTNTTNGSNAGNSATTNNASQVNASTKATGTSALSDTGDRTPLVLLALLVLVSLGLLGACIYRRHLHTPKYHAKHSR